MPLPFTSRSDKRAWADARDFADLGRLMADWLEGRLSSRPGYCGGCPEQETRDLVPVLAAANRRGFLTTDSQPGDDSHARGSRWQQRAAVSGFVYDRRLLKSLTREAKRVGLEVRTYAPGDRDKGRIPVTLQDGRRVTGFGSAIRPVDLKAHWEGVGSGAYQQLVEAHQLTIIEPDWGPSDALWRMLAVAVR